MKNLDKKQAVLCHRKPLGRQRTRQRYLPQCIIGFLLLLISIAIQAQIPQELIDKARAAGMTEEQIQREIACYRKYRIRPFPSYSASTSPTDRATRRT